MFYNTSIEQTLQDCQRFDFREVGQVQAVVFKNTVDDMHPVLSREAIKRHILEVDAEQAGEGAALFGRKVMRVGREQIGELAV